MTAPTSTEQFIDLVRQSELVDEETLTHRLGQINARTVWSDAPDLLANELVRQGVLTPFHVTNLLKGRWRGFFIDKYRLLEVIGVGGMGQVFLAEHKVMRRLVALKVLTLKPGADPTILLRFQREARAAATLDHPHIVHAYDADHDDKHHYLVMEYVDGTSLADLVKRRGPLSVGRATNYIRQAALGLQHAHEQGVIHRDMKPSNLLLDRQGMVRLLDMGLAKLYLDHADNLTLEHNNGQALGTADYVAPEQIATSHDVDPRADLYALGGTLYFLLMGRPPFPLPTVGEKLLAHQRRMPPSVRQQRSDVPGSLEQVLNQMMAKLPEQRYPSAAAVADTLARWADPIEPPADDDIVPPCPAVAQLLQLNAPPARPTRSSTATSIPTLRSLSAATAAARPAASNQTRPARCVPSKNVEETPGGSRRDKTKASPKPIAPRPPARPTKPAMPVAAPGQPRAGYSTLLAGNKTGSAGHAHDMVANPKRGWLRRHLAMLVTIGMVLIAIGAGTIGGMFFGRPTLPAAEHKVEPVPSKSAPTQNAPGAKR